MKRYKRMLILVAVLAVISAATFGLSRYEEKQEQIKNSDAVILEIPADSVTALSWEYSSGDGLSFTKSDGKWNYDEDEAFPVSEEKVNTILEKFESFGVTFVIENVEDYGQYGLEDPEAILHLTAGEESYDLKLGAFSKMDEQRYIDIGDGNVYLVGEDPIDYIDSSLSAMILHDDTPGFETVVDITFAGSENYTVVRQDESTHTYDPENDIYFTQQSGKTVPLDTEAVKTYLNTVTGLDLLEYATYNATAEELETYGMDDPVLSVTVNYTYTDEEENQQADTCTFHISENPTERAAADKAEADGEEEIPEVTRYVRIGDSQIVYLLDSVDYEILEAAAYDDLRHKELYWGDFSAVTQIDVTLEGKTHSLVSVTEEDAKLWYYGTQEGRELDLTDLETAFGQLSAESFTEEAPAKAEEISLTLHLDNENYPTVHLQLYRYDGDHCLATVEGTPVSLIARTAAMDLVEAVQAIVLNEA